MNVMSPGGLFNTGMGDSSSSAIIKELREKHNNLEVCGACGVDSGAGAGNLLVCGKCKNRKFCSVKCQKNAWKTHKKLCEPAEESD
jgi:hypothetical protein